MVEFPAHHEPVPLYPVICGCIGEGRNAAWPEVRRVALRMAEESPPAGGAWTRPGRRCLIRMARFAAMGDRG